MLKRGQRWIAISCQSGNSCGRYVRYFRSLLLVLGFLALSAPAVHADTPVTLFKSFAGTINITGTGGTLRTAADGTNSCSVTNNGTMQLLGVPAGSTIVAAYLYWAGSGGDLAGGAAADYNVTFKGTNVTADRPYTASYNNSGNILYFFGGVKDVTSLVTGNATYTFSNLTVQNANVTGGGSYCSSAAVLSAFALVVIYSNPSETLHVVNLWEGLQTFRDSAITLTPSNFQVPSPAPATALNSRHLVLTWEGDSGNSGTGTTNGNNEALTFCAPFPCAGTALTDSYNPTNNQFNSTVDVPLSGPFSGVNTTWGVDLDMYDITNLVHAGNSSAQAVYSSGADLVLLANQTMSIANTSVADLRLTKTHSGSFASGGNGTYQLAVHNNGPSATTGTAGNPITVTDTIPAGLTYLSSNYAGWTIDTTSLPTVRWTYTGTLASGADLPPITLQVRIPAAVGVNITNTASVAGPDFDHISSNNTSSDTVTVVLLPPMLTVVKSATPSPAVNPGQIVTYSVLVTNSGAGGATSVVAQDHLSPYVSWGINSYGIGVPFQFVDGASPNQSGLTIGAPIVYSNNNGATWSYVPSSTGGGAPIGYDANVTNWRIPMTGTMNTNGANFTINYQVRVK
jgi:MSHA biogenesis protein MshQ